MTGFPKRRYEEGRYGMWTHGWEGYFRFHHVLNLFVAYRWEREHPARIVQTDRYKRWITQRDSR